MRESLDLAVNGLLLSGWHEATVTLPIEGAAGQFDLRYSGVANRSGRLPVGRGDVCALRIGADTVITGAVDKVSGKHDAKAHDLVTTGRDATGDLVDCAADHESGQWTESTVLQIAADLAKPFGVKVQAQVDVGAALPSFALEVGESAFEAIRRACRFRGLLPTADGLGNLVLTRVGARTSGTTLVVGRNVDELSFDHDNKDRFSQYIAVSQGLGGDDVFGSDAASQRAVATDSGVKRHRPTIIEVDEEASLGTLADHAKWQRNVAAGKSENYTVSWTGWRDEQGVLWRPNTEVRLVDEFIGVDGKYVINLVRLLVGEKEHTAELELVPRATYDLGPLPVEEE